MRDDVLQCNEDVVQGQAGLHAQSDDRSLLDARKDGASLVLRTHRLVLDRLTEPPLPHGLLVDTEAPRELRG